MPQLETLTVNGTRQFTCRPPTTVKSRVVQATVSARSIANDTYVWRSGYSRNFPDRFDPRGRCEGLSDIGGAVQDYSLVEGDRNTSISHMIYAPASTTWEYCSGTYLTCANRAAGCSILRGHLTLTPVPW